MEINRRRIFTVNRHRLTAVGFKPQCITRFLPMVVESATDNAECIRGIAFEVRKGLTAEDNSY